MRSFGPFDGVAILGAARHLPGEPIDNAHALAACPKRAAIDDARRQFLAKGLEQTLGVQHRHWVHVPGTELKHGEEATSVDLALAAAEAALADAGIEADALAHIFVVSSTPHRMTSTIAAPLGAALGTEAPAVDVRVGCAGGLFALQLAAATLTVHPSAPMLLVGAETFSKIIPSQHEAAVVALGDGAAALVLGHREGAAIEAISLATDGNLGGLVTTDGALPPTAAEIERGGYVLGGQPEGLAEAVPGKYRAVIDATLERAGITGDAIDVLIPHPTNRGMAEAVAKHVGAKATYVAAIAEHANIGAAGWIAALAEARRRGVAKAGQRVMVAAVGGGLSSGAAIFR